MSRPFFSLTVRSGLRVARPGAVAVLTASLLASTSAGCSVAPEDDADEASSERERDEPDGDHDREGDEREPPRGRADAAPASPMDGGALRDAAALDAQPSARDGGVAVADAGSAAPAMCGDKVVPPRARGPLPPFRVGPAAGGLPVYWPTDGWRSEAPEKLGLDAEKLRAAVELKTASSNTQAMLVIRHGYVAAEKYFGRTTELTRVESYSMAKSYTSGLVGIALAEGKLRSTDERVCSAYPEQWRCDDAGDPRSRITIDHAMNLSTGLAWREDWRSTARGPNDALSPNMLDTVLARDAVEEPGLRRRYSTGDPALLSGVLQKATGMTVYAYAKQKIFDVIGTPDVRWNTDSKGRTTSYAGLSASAREYAKYGYLYLQRGQWDGKQVVPAAWIDKTTQAADPCEDWNRYLWHQNLPVRLGPQDPACDGIFCSPTALVDLPRDGFFAEGVLGQFIFVIPSADLVVVRLASDQAGSERWDDYARGFLTALLAAVKD